LQFSYGQYRFLIIISTDNCKFPTEENVGAQNLKFDTIFSASNFAFLTNCQTKSRFHKLRKIPQNTTWCEGLHTKHQQNCSNRAKQVSSHRPCHLSQPRHRLGLKSLKAVASWQTDVCHDVLTDVNSQGDRQRKQQNGPVDHAPCTTLLARGYVHYWKRRRRSGKRYTSGKNKTNRWTERRGPTNFHTSMITYC